MLPVLRRSPGQVAQNMISAKVSFLFQDLAARLSNLSRTGPIDADQPELVDTNMAAISTSENAIRHCLHGNTYAAFIYMRLQLALVSRDFLHVL